MPPGRNRTTNPQGRQKSCSECARAKRRCDLRQPSCLRCTRQDLTCLYPPSAATTTTPDSRSASSTSMTIDPVVDDNSPFCFDVPTLPNSNDLELLDFDIVAGHGLAETGTFDNQLNGDIEETCPFAHMNYLAEKLSSTPHISPHAHSRIEYSTKQLKAAPAMMVLENQTPWCHPRLYEEYMPRSLQDAHAACALYSSKNEVNATFVARHITDHVNELLNTPLPSTSTEILAHAHALMLYQVMLFFSGDFQYHGQVNALMHHLEEAGFSLQKLVMQEADPSGSLSLYPSIEARTAWKSFIFRETARRSLLVLFHFLALCSLLRGNLPLCSSHRALASLGSRVTISAHLWNATSAIDFAFAWNEREHHVVKDLDFSEVLETAKADDVDVFGRMIMTGLMGVDDMKGWFRTRGGTF